MSGLAESINTVLAIETSCDDTSVAVVTATGQVLALCSNNQDSAHARFGGVVPEIECRNHTYNLLPLIEKALASAKMSQNEIDGIAVTASPGLVGSLLVGLVTAKTLALSWKKPFVGINHLEGHLLAPFLRDQEFAPPPDFTYPFVALTVSGGHTSLYRVAAFGDYRLLGRTVDDAAGEAFDKFGKMLGLGFPGGVAVDRLSRTGNAAAFTFPRSMLHEENCNFSFSGLKAAAGRLLASMSESEKQSRGADLCASFQEAIVDVLLAKLARAVNQEGLKRAVITGGVSANTRLRERTLEWSAQTGVPVVVPPLRYCTDNAAMIGYAGVQRLARGERSDQSLGPKPRDPLGSK